MIYHDVARSSAAQYGHWNLFRTAVHRRPVASLSIGARPSLISLRPRLIRPEFGKGNRPTRE